MKAFVLVVGAALFFMGCAGQVKTNLNSLEYTKDSYGQSSRKLAGHFSLCPKGLKTFKGEGWEMLVKRANSCVYKKSWNRLNILAKYMAERDYNSPWGSYFLSLYQMNLGNQKHSLWLIDLALKKAPQVGLLYYQKSKILQMTGLQAGKNSQEAFKLMKKAIQLDPKLVDGHLFLAQSYMRDQEMGQAERHLKKVLILDPKNKISQQYLAEIKKNKNKNADNKSSKKLGKTKLSQR